MTNKIITALLVSLFALSLQASDIPYEDRLTEALPDEHFKDLHRQQSGTLGSTWKMDRQVRVNANFRLNAFYMCDGRKWRQSSDITLYSWFPKAELQKYEERYDLEPTTFFRQCVDFNTDRLHRNYEDYKVRQKILEKIDE